VSWSLLRKRPDKNWNAIRRELMGMEQPRACEDSCCIQALGSYDLVCGVWKKASFGVDSKFERTAAEAALLAFRKTWAATEVQRRGSMWLVDGAVIRAGNAKSPMCKDS